MAWLKVAAGLRQVKQRGLERVDAQCQLAMLARLPKALRYESADRKGAPGEESIGLIHLPDALK
ncbi:hypothetical protein [Halopseudomonas formosensis]|uniref:Uncharacterized protein n=1 Tax=Halopseudomonas formosensis TaxID=1002526 RepID=A0ABU5BXI8_9GAMM|nr:hypothetical protein [Halopseudomonas formosensis]MDX9687257.1 hypothetical protein [Halopseudomonas formosensis]